MSDQKNNIFVRILRWLVEEWIKALLLAAATLVLGSVVWVYRIYIKELLTSKYYFETYGFVWVLLFIVIAVLPILLFVLITWLMSFRRPIKRLKDSRDIEMVIGNWIDDLSLSQKRQHFYYADVAKQINVSPNRLKAYLEVVAADHGKQLKMGKETFEFV